MNKVIASLTINNSQSINIHGIEHGISDEVEYSYSNVPEITGVAVIEYSDTGSPYIVIDDSRYYLDDFIKVE